jgi:hypothetical protein
MVIVENEAAFTETLFKPINGRTADGYVVKRGKRFCDVWVNGKVYRINSYLVWCMGSPGAWTYAVCELPFTLSALRDAARALAVGYPEWVGNESRYTFTA